MTPTILALRAITAVFLQRILALVAIGAGVIAFIVLAIIAALIANVSGFWGLLLIIVIPIILVVTLVLWFLYLASNRLLPRKVTKAEREQLRGISSKLFGVVETAKTPPILLLPMIAKDVVRGRESNVVRRAIDDSSSLRGDFRELMRMFDGDRS